MTPPTLSPNETINRPADSESFATEKNTRVICTHPFTSAVASIAEAFLREGKIDGETDNKWKGAIDRGEIGGYEEENEQMLKIWKYNRTHGNLLLCVYIDKTK